MKLIHRNREIHKRFIDLHCGKWLKEMGDGILVQFNSSLDSVNCALDIQKACKELSDYKLRIGIHIGDVMVEKEDIFGDGVNIASRIQTIADPGGIYISESVHVAIRGRKDLQTMYLGEFQLKNVGHPIRIYALQDEDLPSPSPEKIKGRGSTKNPSKSSTLAYAALIIFVLLAVVWTFEKLTEIPIHFNKTHKTEDLARSIAVFPFLDMSPGKNYQWLADGLCEEMIDRLSKIQSLDVKSRSSSFYFKDKNYDIKEAAQMLNVNNILEGSVRTDDSLLRISTKLIDMPSGSLLWSETYESSFNDILKTQTEIANAVYNLIITDLAPQELAQHDELVTRNNEAYQEFLKGKYYSRVASSENLVKARQSFERAVELDPNYAIAYSWLGKVYQYFGGRLFGITPEQANEKVLEYLGKALELDPQLNDAMINLANQKIWYDWNFSEGVSALEEAYYQNPNDESSIYNYAETLCVLGKSNQAIGILKQYLRKNPYSVPTNQMLGWAYGFNMNLEQAVEQHKKVLSLEPSITQTHHYLAEAYFFMGDYKNSYLQWKTGFEKDGTPVFQEGMIRTLLHIGEEEEALELMDQLINRAKEEYVSSYIFAKAYADIMNYDQALDSLEKAYEVKDIAMMVVWIEPAFKPLHSHPRFKEIIRLMDFPDEITSRF